MGTEMIECPGPLQKEHIQEIATLRAEMEQVKSFVSDISSMKELLAKQIALQEKYDARNEKIDTIIEQQIATNTKTEQTLKLINDNLSSMNTEMKETKTRVANLETSVEKIPLETELKDTRQELETVKSNSFDIMGWIKNTVFPALLSGGVVYYITQVMPK